MNRLASILLTLLAPVAVAVAAWMTFTSETSSRTPPSALAAGQGAGATPRDPAPVTPSPVPPPRAEATPPPDDPGAIGLDVSLAGADAFGVPLRHPPRAGLVFDLRSGQVLWRLAPRRVLPMASLTKIMTALLVVDGSRPDEPVHISQVAVNTEGSGVGLLPVGRRVRLETLLYGLLMVSGNDAAVALAEHVAGSESAFVARMNRRARALGLSCTSFASPHGLDEGDRSCPRDLAVMTRLAMRRPRIRRIAAREYADFRFPIKGRRLYLSGHNPLQRLDYPGAIGLKTGYTSEAGRCFVGVARQGGRTLGVVLLHSRDPSKHAPKLLNAAFALG